MIALSVVNARVRSDSTGATVDVPALLTPEGELRPLLDYCVAHAHDRSVGWMRKVVGAVKLFLEYLQANPNEQNTHQLFANFGQRLYTGTFDRTTGMDPADLCWRPKDAEEAGNVIVRLTEFFDWLGARSMLANSVNPSFSGGAVDRLIDEASYQHRRDRAMLGHAWKSTAAESRKGETGRLFRPALRLPHVLGDPPAFPEDRFPDLLFEGFKVGRRYDHRNMLLTLLQHGAGFRTSEPFHLYTCDVSPDPLSPSSASVLIHHPELGVAPRDANSESIARRHSNRRDYLQQRWALQPRSLLLTADHAGWKGGAHEQSGNGYFFRAYWAPPVYGQWFLQLWYRYMDDLMNLERLHPFAFVNMRRGEVGTPYKIGQYEKAHAAAVKRIGMQVSKELGTTPHGHRHAYGRRLSNAGIEPVMIKRVMHHASIESQLVYTQPTLEEIHEMLKRAMSTLTPERGVLDEQIMKRVIASSP